MAYISEGEARRRSSPPTKKLIARVWNEEVKCFVCGLDVVERAHIVAVSLGGENDPSNFVLLCPMHHEDAPDVGDSRYFHAWLDHSKEEPYKYCRYYLCWEEALELWARDREDDQDESLKIVEFSALCVYSRLGGDGFRLKLRGLLNSASEKLGGVTTHGSRLSRGTRTLMMQYVIQALVETADGYFEE